MSYWYYLLCLLLLTSCGGSNGKKKENKEVVVEASKSEVKYVNSLKLLQPKKNQLYSFGDELVVEFESKNRFVVDSSAIYVDGHEVARLGSGETRFSLPIGNSKVGLMMVKVVAWHPDNKEGVATGTIRVKPAEAPIRCKYHVLKTYPHDSKAYTQGLTYQDGFMYEGTGQYGESSIRKVDMNSGKIHSVLSIDNQYFGEGITIFGDKIYQITWRSRKGFVYDLKSFSLESSFEYGSEGWGITTMGDYLVMSDGTNKLYHIAPSTFNILREVEVYDNVGPINQLNELEYVGGLIWANVWLTDRIVAIDPKSGAVKYDLDLSGLLSAAERGKLDDKDDVLNGIAWNPVSKTFYLTGKRWPKLFEIKVEIPN